MKIKLTPRMTELLQAMERGLSNRAIAAELQISEHTVKVHLWRLYRRIEVNSRLAAVRWFGSHGGTPIIPDMDMALAFFTACSAIDTYKRTGVLDASSFEHFRQVIEKRQATT